MKPLETSRLSTASGESRDDGAEPSKSSKFTVVHIILRDPVDRT